MKLNQELLDWIEENRMEKIPALLFCFAAEYLGDQGISYLIDNGLITSENEHKFRINLLMINYESDEPIAKIPLFSSEGNADFRTFTALLGLRGFNSSGHPNNPMPYAVISTGGEAEDAFNNFVSSLGNDFDMNRLLDAVNYYYENTTEKAKGIARYLQENALMDYKSFKTQKNPGNAQTI